jgi:integrase/recombinase XerD
MQVEFKMRYINHWIDDLGRHRYRFRRKGFPGVELPVDGDPNSLEFAACYYAALRGERTNAALATVIARGGSGSVGDAIQQYLDSTTFNSDYSDSTKALRRPILKAFLKPGVGPLPLAQMNDKYIRRWLETAPTKGVKRTWLLAIKPFFEWAVESVQLIDADPTIGIQVKVEESQGHPTWGNEEVEQFRGHHPFGTSARLALELLIHLANRRGDVISLGRQHVKDGWLVYTQEKNRRRKPVTVETPMPEAVKAAIEACPSPPESLTFLTNEWGRPFGKRTFNKQFRKWCDEAGLPKQWKPHGLRKGGSKLMADSGCTPHEIMAVTGHKTMKEVTRYTEAFDRKQAAARAQAKVAAAKDNVVPLTVAARR